ncbi:myosin regulatory light chain 2, ventricular/cardiac muscle isoform isoform X1 [Pyrgilauda ruficollis]|nr:myosin regulatory light chain 2, ventricular/cardiac muscle isoform isoform X1 [Pyrgilauda ruficollis]
MLSQSPGSASVIPAGCVPGTEPGIGRVKSGGSEGVPLGHPSQGHRQLSEAMAPKKAKKRIEGANSNVFSMFEQAQIQEFKEAFTIMDQNRDGFIDKADLRDTFAALGEPSFSSLPSPALPTPGLPPTRRAGLGSTTDPQLLSPGRLNVKNEEIDEMIKEAPGPINFTVFLTMFGEKLKGADPEETILNAFKVFDPEGKGLKSAYIKEMLMTQGERFSQEEIDQMFAAFPPDMSGNLDYKNLVHVITHGEEKD